MRLSIQAEISDSMNPTAFAEILTGWGKVGSKYLLPLLSFRYRVFRWSLVRSSTCGKRRITICLSMMGWSCLTGLHLAYWGSHRRGRAGGQKRTRCSALTLLPACASERTTARLRIRTCVLQPESGEKNQFKHQEPTSMGSAGPTTGRVRFGFGWP